MSLTRYPSGSLKELLSIAFPLMLSALSVALMLFVDRIFLARYSTDALNAAANASTLGWAFIFGALVLTSIAEVFVAQYNGAGHTEKLGQPVWQMLWVSLFSFLFFTPLSIWGTDFIYQNSHYSFERDYFRWMVLFGPMHAAYGALAAFFICQGKTALISILALAANCLNAGFDWLLIFGFDGWINEMGVKGAAIATSLSAIFQTVVLFAIFLSPYHRKEHRTSDFRIRWPLLWDCLKIGVPGATAASLEIGGWALFYHMMTWVGPAYITLASISQSVFFLFMFFADGVMKAVTAIVGNLIGSRQFSLISSVLKNGIFLHVLFFLTLLLLFPTLETMIVRLFILDAPLELKSEVLPYLPESIFLMLTYLLFNGIRFTFTGTLTAAGDTFFILLAGIFCMWLFMVIPTYVFVVKGNSTPLMGMIINAIYAVLTTMVYMSRYLFGKWKKVVLP